MYNKSGFVVTQANLENTLRKNSYESEAKEEIGSFWQIHGDTSFETRSLILLNITSMQRNRTDIINKLLVPLQKTGSAGLRRAREGTQRVR